MATRSYTHLRSVYQHYERIGKHSIETAVKKELSGDLEKTYLAIGEAVVTHG